MVTVTMPREQADVIVVVLLGEVQRLHTAGEMEQVDVLLYETVPPLLEVASPWALDLVRVALRETVNAGMGQAAVA